MSEVEFLSRVLLLSQSAPATHRILFARSCSFHSNRGLAPPADGAEFVLDETIAASERSQGIAEQTFSHKIQRSTSNKSRRLEPPTEVGRGARNSPSNSIIDSSLLDNRGVAGIRGHRRTIGFSHDTTNNSLPRSPLGAVDQASSCLPILKQSLRDLRFPRRTLGTSGITFDAIRVGLEPLAQASRDIKQPSTSNMPIRVTAGRRAIREE